MTHGTDCTAATFTRVVWVGVRGGGLVVGYLVTPGPGQSPALTPARQPLTWGTLSPPRYKCWQGERKNPVLARTFRRSEKGSSEDCEVQKVPPRK